MLGRAFVFARRVAGSIKESQLAHIRVVAPATNACIIDYLTFSHRMAEASVNADTDLE